MVKVFLVKFVNTIIIIVLGVTMPASGETEDSYAMDISLVGISESVMHSNLSVSDELRNEGN